MKRRLLLILLGLLFLSIAVYSGYQLFLLCREYYIGKQVYDDLSQYIQIEVAPPSETTSSIVPSVTPTTEPSTPPTEASETTETIETIEPIEIPEVPEENPIAWPKVDFETLREINPDVVAWIYIEGTNINYPVVQGEDNEYYLYRLFDGTYNRAGSIFVDCRNNGVVQDRNTVLHGHHMKNMSMFAQITRYKYQSFYDAHPYGILLTPEGNYKLEFFAGYVTDSDSSAWKMRFSSDEEYLSWLNTVISKSQFTSNIVPSIQDRVITLSTCTYEYDDARYVLQGVLR